MPHLNNQRISACGIKLSPSISDCLNEVFIHPRLLLPILSLPTWYVLAVLHALLSRLPCLQRQCIHLACVQPLHQ